MFEAPCCMLPLSLSPQPHSQPHPNQSQLLIALSLLQALALVLSAWNVLPCPGQTPTQPARAQSKSSLLCAASPTFGSPHPTREHRASSDSDLFFCRFCAPLLSTDRQFQPGPYRSPAVWLCNLSEPQFSHVESTKDTIFLVGWWERGRSHTKPGCSRSLGKAAMVA